MKRTLIRLGCLAVLFVLLQGLIHEDRPDPDLRGLSEAEIRYREDMKNHQLLPVQLMMAGLAGLSAFLMVSMTNGDPVRLILLERMADRMDRQETRIRDLEDRILTGKKRAEQIGHQMKTKLGSMALYADLCEESTEALDNLQAEILASDRLVREMLDSFVRKQRQPGFQYESVRIADILRQSVPPSVSARISGEAAGFADPFWLRAAFETLLENAAEYGQGTTDIRIEESPHQIRITICSGKAAAGQESEVFGLRSHEYPGRTHYGIGLDMARAVIRQHHGTMTIRNDEEVFSLCILLPRHWLEE